MVESKKIQLTIGGKVVEVETGKYARSASSSVTIRLCMQQLQKNHV